MTSGRASNFWDLDGLFSSLLHQKDITVLHCLFVRGVHKYPVQFLHRVKLGFYRQQLDCLLNSLFRLTTKKTSKLRITGPLWRKSPAIGAFASQRVSNAESGSLSWHHHEMWIFPIIYYFHHVHVVFFKMYFKFKLVWVCVNFTAVIK